MAPHTSRLIGRDQMLASLLADVSDSGCVRAITGRAGIGKSRLVEEVHRSVVAASPGAVVLIGRSPAAGYAWPLRPIREALLSAARLGWRPPPELAPYVPVLASLVPDWGEPTPQSPDPSLLGEAVLRLLSAAASRGTVVLVMEDMQWCDAESLAVLDYLTSSVAGSRVVMLLTCRDGERTAGGRFVAELIRRRVADEIKLEALTASEVIELAEDRTGEPVPDEMAGVLIDRSAGVPLFVEELVRATASSGWDLVGSAVPGSLLGAVAARLDDLDDAERSMVIAAALLGLEFDWRLAATAAALDERAASAVLRSVSDVGLIEPIDDRYRFRHVLIRDAVVSGSPLSERARLALHLVDRLTDMLDGDASDRWVLAAQLALDGGDRGRAADLFEAAARRLLDAGALGSASEVAERAHATLSSVRRSVLCLETAVRSGDVERARALASGLIDDPRAGSVRAETWLLLAEVDLSAGEWQSAAYDAERAREAGAGDESVAPRCDVVLAHAAMGDDAIARAHEAAERALHAATAAGMTNVVCSALEVLGRIERGRDLPQAEQLFERALEAATEGGLIVARIRALHELGTIDLFGTLNSERLERARAEATASGAIGTVAAIDLQLAALHDERAELADALERARACEETSRRFGLATLPMSLALQAMVHARSGDRDAMRRAIAAARGTAADVDYVESGISGQALAIDALVRGDLIDASGHLDDAMAIVRRRPGATLPYPGLWALVRTVVDDDGAAARLEVSQLEFDTPVSRATLVLAEAVAAGRRGDSTAALDLFETGDRWFVESGSHYRRMLHHLVIAPLALRDDWADPESWLRESLAKAEALEIGPIAARCRAVMRQLKMTVPRRRTHDATIPPRLAGLGITQREAEVLGLVVRGRTNRQIAEELYISLRTVDKHVERILAKAAVQRRDDLAALAPDDAS